MKLTFSGGNSFPIPDLKSSPNIDNILKIFLVIVNLRVSKNVFPESEKMAITKPVVKGALDSQLLSSYRTSVKFNILIKSDRVCDS